MACAARVQIRSCAAALPGWTVCLVMRSTLGESGGACASDREAAIRKNTSPRIEQKDISK